MSISGADLDRILAEFAVHLVSDYQLQAVTPALLGAATDLCVRYGRIHGLRSLGAIQLAACLGVQYDLKLAAGPSVVFVCADAVLWTVAELEGIAVENPDKYP